jgi:hypothetical protein
VPDNEAIPFVRWPARVFGVLVAGFFLFMFIGETFERRHPPSPAIEPMTVVKLIPAFAYVIGMFLALKWERAGAKLGAASLGLLAIGLFVSPVRRDALAALWLGIVGLTFSLPVILYGLCWWLEDRDRKLYRAGS